LTHTQTAVQEACAWFCTQN